MVAVDATAALRERHTRRYTVTHGTFVYIFCDQGTFFTLFDPDGILAGEGQAAAGIFILLAGAAVRETASGTDQFQTRAVKNKQHNTADEHFHLRKGNGAPFYRS